MAEVVILAGDSDSNLGDRAIVHATCAELRRQEPNVRIALMSDDTRRDREYFHAEPIARGLRGFPRLLWKAWRSDAILCGGGGLFQDDTSLIKMPYWAARLALLRCLGAKIIGYSLGVGPLGWASSRLAARLAFACMSTVSVRDETAKRLSESLTRKPVHLVPDPALLLDAAPDHEAREVMARAGVPVDGTTLIGVAARRWFHHRPTLIPHKWARRYHLRPIPGQESNRLMVSLLAEVLDTLVEQHSAHVVLLPTYNISHEADDATCREIADAMSSQRTNLLLLSDPRLYKAVTGRLHVMIGSRMHPTMFAAAMGTPCIGLSYNPKFEGFFDLIGVDDKVIQLEDFVRGQKKGELIELVRIALADHATDLDRIQDLMTVTRRFTADIVSQLVDNRARA